MWDQWISVSSASAFSFLLSTCSTLPLSQINSVLWDFQSFLTSLLGNISFLEQKTQWGRPWGYINLQKLCDLNKGFSLRRISSKYKFMLTPKSQSATECFPCLSFALSFCAYVCDCVSVGENQWELRLSGMKWKLEKQWVGNLGPKVKEWVTGGCLAPRGLHQSHLWRSMCSFMLLTGGEKMWFAGVWPEKSAEPTRKLLSP